jgi:XTP/dITP diphosphohydrolase
MKKLVLASNNAKKMKELNALLAPLGWEVVPQAELGMGKRKSRTAPSWKTRWQRPATLRSPPACQRWPMIRASVYQALGGAPGVSLRALPASPNPTRPTTPCC